MSHIYYPTPVCRTCRSVIEPGTTHETNGRVEGGCEKCGLALVDWAHPDEMLPKIWEDCHPDCAIGPNGDHHGTMEYRCMTTAGAAIPFPGEA